MKKKIVCRFLIELTSVILIQIIKTNYCLQLFSNLISYLNLFNTLPVLV